MVIAFASRAIVWSSMAFIFEVNSKQVTPSPISHSAAEPFRASGSLPALMSTNRSTQSGATISASPPVSVRWKVRAPSRR